MNWLGVLGTYGDLGSGVKWEAPFPDMGPAIKQHGGKQRFSQAVSLINARKVPHTLPFSLAVHARCLTHTSFLMHSARMEPHESQLYSLSRHL